MDGEKVLYTYDDGQESLAVEWSDPSKEIPLTAEETQHLLRVFRQGHGMSSLVPGPSF